MKNFITKRNLISLAGILLIILLWQLAAFISESDQIVPSPGKTMVSTFNILADPGLWPNIGRTIIRGLLGFILSFFIAFIIGIPAGINNSFFLFINPLLVTIRSTPVVSIILLAIIWLGSEMVPVFIALLTMLPIISLNIIEGIKNVDQDLIEMGAVYKVKRKHIMRDIYLPSILPFLTGGISNALGFGWRAIIIGEVLSQPIKGIGTRMQEAQSYLLVSELIAWTLIAIIISYIFESLVRSIEKRIMVWKQV
ncbi:MAG: ABC transporter permease [Bacteroidota bacterium]